MQFLRDHIHNSSLSVSKDSKNGIELLDAINNLKLELIRLEFKQRSPETDIIKLQEIIAAKRSMISQIDTKIKEWKGTLDIIIPKLSTYKERSFRSDAYTEFKIKDSDDILPYLSNMDNALTDQQQAMDQSV